MDMYEANINPMEVDNNFYVNCSQQVMRILFRGDALGVYSKDNPDTCMAEEVEPAHFLIRNARTQPGCNVEKLEGLHTYSLELVVELQEGIRHFNDPVHVVTCNYELGGTDVTVKQTGSEGAIVKNVEWMQEGESSVGNVTLRLYDSRDNEITAVKLGSFVQLRATYNHYDANEDSFKVWHCRAYASSYQYYFVVAGCGEGDVIKKNRGFLTKYTTSGDSTAKSVYFRFFGLPGSSTLHYECNYIVCLNSSCVGRSCGEPIRSKRELDSQMIDTDFRTTSLGVSTNLPSVRTPPILILPLNDTPKAINIANGDLLKHPSLKPKDETTLDDPIEPIVTKETSKDPRFEQLFIGIGCVLTALTLVIAGMAVSIIEIYKKLVNNTNCKSCSWHHNCHCPKI